jgi:membrane-associated protease RseP (regulator of RpoE activity)
MQYRRIVIEPGDFRYRNSNTTTNIPQNLRKHILLFLATLLTTTGVGAMMSGENPFAGFGALAAGLPFSVTILSILGIHEFAHYFTARAWGIKVTLPYFIPAPVLPIGTFGAVIVMKSSIPTRKALIDVGASGPIAGFIVSIVACIIGLSLTTAVPLESLGPGGGYVLGESLLFKALSALYLVPAPADYVHVLHPVAFAGWLGLFVTALNLLPIGQLDGGHILFALSPRLHDLVRRIRIPVLLLLGLTFWSGWYVWAGLSLIFGKAHPYPDRMDVSVGRMRMVVAVGAILVFLLCITMTPISPGTMTP